MIVFAMRGRRMIPGGWTDWPREGGATFLKIPA
jgi:hypothetical protein